MNRLNFLRKSLMAALAIFFKPLGRVFVGIRQAAAPVPMRSLGRTGQKIAILAPGGFHLGQVASEKEAARMIHYAIDQGLNFFDTAESYQGGFSEERFGRALRGKRHKVFLMSKTYEPAHRDAKGAQRHLEGSLRRLQTDYLDLWQLHSVQSPQDVDLAFRKGGAMAYILRAKEQGKVRFIGVTGHRDPDANLRAVHYWDQGWTFDTMQMPINPVDFFQSSFQKKVLPELVKRNIGVIAMKTSADGRLLRDKLCSIEECLRYVWSLPVSVAVVGMLSLAQLHQNIEIARNFHPIKPPEKQALLDRLRPHVRPSLEWYKR